VRVKGSSQASHGGFKATVSTEVPSRRLLGNGVQIAARSPEAMEVQADLRSRS
jgi:hypothetical protein